MLSKVYQKINKTIANYSDDATVWVFPSPTPLTSNQQSQLETFFYSFKQNWMSHSVAVHSDIVIVLNRFIIIMAEEESTKKEISGCSKDSLMAFIKLQEDNVNVQLTERNFLTFYTPQGFFTIPLIDLQDTITNGNIKDDDILFDPSISSIFQLKEKWISHVKNTWLYNRYFSIKKK